MWNLASPLAPATGRLAGRGQVGVRIVPKIHSWRWQLDPNKKQSTDVTCVVMVKLGAVRNKELL